MNIHPQLVMQQPATSIKVNVQVFSIAYLIKSTEICHDIVQLI